MEKNKKRGYFGIGIENGKTEVNYGTLFRTAHILGAAFIFIIGQRFKKQSSDVTKSWRHLPTYRYDNFNDFYKTVPYDCQLIGVEMEENAKYIEDFIHPERAIYLLGAEDYGLTKKAIKSCHRLVKLHGERSLNVAVAGSIIMHDRVSKQ